MNNYLATIAARTLDPAPPLRPRLRGRFEPVPALREHSSDGSKWPRSSSSETAPTYPGTEQPDALNPTRQNDFDYESIRSFGPTPHTEESSGLKSTVRRAAAYITDRKVDPSPSVSIGTTRPATVAEPPGQGFDIEPPSVKEIVAAHKQVEPASNPLRPPLTKRASERHRENSPFKSLSADHIEAVNDSSIKSPESPKTFETSQRREGLPRSQKQEQLRERKVETVIIREKSVVESHPGKQSVSQASPPTVPALSQVAKPEEPGPVPAFVPSRIAPRIDNSAEQLTLNRRSPQAQPTVHVTIGRLEVRAVQSSQPQPKPHTATPVMNLDDYLRRRSQGGTR